MFQGVLGSRKALLKVDPERGREAGPVLRDGCKVFRVLVVAIDWQ
jgi:hypothetical protein